MAAALIIANRAFRTAEMALAAGFIRLTSSSGVYLAAERQSVYFGLGTDQPFGLQMSPECTSAFLLLPLILVGAVMVALRPHIATRVLIGLAVAGAAVIAVNQVRILGLVGLVDWLGTDRGYYWGHTLLGSMISIIGGALALVLFVWLSTRQPRSQR
ncbi:exosortase P [Actinokineospora iranica]|uniref:exosortase P n=1 Tax=Actinokineospora iranica TaxID=1271860 RepID=UPI002B4AD7EE|nr:exosortase P [Actinokineospora iranica]